MKTLEDFKRDPLIGRRKLSSKEFEEAYSATQADLDEVGKLLPFSRPCGFYKPIEAGDP
jgi:hypothetical protein